MNLTLHLTPELEARVRKQASELGIPLEEAALASLQVGLASTDEPAPSVSLEEWLREFDSWVAGHESRNPRVDDSREIIYPDRW